MKKLIVILTAAAALIFIPEMSSRAEDPSYIYTIIGNEATIIGYSGEPEYIEVPPTLEGCPVTGIRDNAFCECSSLRSISLPDTIKEIGHHCFYACTSLESVVIPDSVTEIGDGCFCGCISLLNAELPDSLSVIPDSCFRACTSLRHISLPSKTVAVEDYCFSACTELEQVSLNEKLRILGKCSFYMCSSLDCLYIPESVSKIGEYAAGYVPAETGASQKEGFTILGQKDSEAEKYASENSLAFEKSSGAVQAMAAVEMSRKNSPYIYWITAIWGAIAAVGALTIVRIIHQKSTK